jgi:CopG family nickel-responsive transcriptional regulator
MTRELVRFGVAMDGDLLERFDRRIERRGYANRSEALRDLIRADLAAEHVKGGGLGAATLTIVYDHHVRELTERLTEMQHDLGDAVVSTLHVHLDHDHCLEVIVMRGPAFELQEACDRIIATKGVDHGRVVITALPGGGGKSGHGHGNVHGSARGGEPVKAHSHAHGEFDHDHDHVAEGERREDGGRGVKGGGDPKAAKNSKSKGRAR